MYRKYTGILIAVTLAIMMVGSLCVGCSSQDSSSQSPSQTAGNMQQPQEGMEPPEGMDPPADGERPEGMPHGMGGGFNMTGEEFQELIYGVTDKLKQLFQTKNDLYLLTGSGTGGLEAIIVNSLSPGDRVLSVAIGVFGERFATIAEKFGAEVTRLSFEWGKAADADEVRKALESDPEIKAVLITHNETSTGVTNDLASISSVVKEFDKLLLVDAISSLGSIDLPVDPEHQVPLPPRHFLRQDYSTPTRARLVSIHAVSTGPTWTSTITPFWSIK